MNNNNQAEELLEKIFYYMGCLVDEKEFSITIQMLTDLGKSLVNCDRVTFWYWDKKKKQYWTLAASNGDKITVPEGSGVVGSSIEKCELIMINDPYNDERFNSKVDKETGYVTKSILCLPITNEQGEVIGAYQAINKLDTEEGFEEKDARRLALAAVYSGKMLENYLLKFEAQTDELTGLKSRNGLMDYYVNVVEDAFADTESCMIMCDVDSFRLVNEKFGHGAGDEELVFIAKLLKHNVGSPSTVVRWDGEKFLIVLPKANLEVSLLLADMLRETVEKASYQYGEEEIRVTMSFGVAMIDKTKNLDENIGLVEEKLAEAKSNGCNGVAY